MFCWPVSCNFTQRMQTLQQNKNFQEFLSYFPIVELPVTIQYNDLHRLTRSNDPLPDALLQQFIFPNLEFTVDEFTEFLPCFLVQTQGPQSWIILWVGRLLHYSFILMVFEPDGRLISQAEIAGFYSEDENVFQRMAHFNEDEEIYIVETNLSQKESEVVLDQTKKWVLVMQEDGQLRRMDL